MFKVFWIYKITLKYLSEKMSHEFGVIVITYVFIKYEQIKPKKWIKNKLTILT